MDYFLSIFVVLGSLINGFAILNISKIDIPKFKSLNFGIAFFIGILFLIVSVRSFSFIFKNAFVGLIIVAFLSLILIYVSRQYLIDIVKNNITFKNCVLFTFSFLILFIVLLIYWLRTSDLNSPFATIGSLHSVRYVNLSEYILQNNYIPIVGQNTGQSILTYIVLAMGAKSGYIALTTFLVASIIFLSMIVYGLFNIYLKNNNFSLIATLIFFTANTALSTSHILVIDSGSPFFLNGYTDTILGMFIILMFVILYSNFSKINRLNFCQYALILFLMVGTFYVAPQNILLTMGVLTIILIFRFSLKHKYTIGLLIFLSLIISVPQGGMLTPSPLQDNISISGMMKVERDGRPTVQIHPGLMYYLQNIDDFDRTNHYNRIKHILKLLEKHDFKSALFYSEEIFVTSIRMLFFPIMGFILLFFYTNKIKEKYFLEDENFFNVDVLKNFGFLVFAIGFFVAFTFEIHGYKWEMARFIIPGIMFGMFSFIISMFTILRENPKNIRLKIVALLILTSFGPISNFLLTLEKGIVENTNTTILKNRYEVFSKSSAGQGNLRGFYSNLNLKIKRSIESQKNRN